MTADRPKAPGKNHREGISLRELFKLFPDDETARKWFERMRWGDAPWCPHCGSYKVKNCTHHSMPYRCGEKDCRKRFSVRIGTPMQDTKLGYQVWAIAIYLLTTSLKGQSSMKLHRDLDVTQTTAWFLAHRIRETFNARTSSTTPDMSGPVEVDEAYFGGLRKNMSNSKRKELAEQGAGRGPDGKTAVVGIKDRDTNTVRVNVVDDTQRDTLVGFIDDNIDPDATIYTDEATVYEGLSNHGAVKHSVKEYVNGQIHINGMESFWSTLKRAHKGTFHKMSPKHLNRYVQEFAGRHNVREEDTLTQMALVVQGFEGKRLTFDQLKMPNGRSSSARPLM
ncbi:MAG: IS1595 family transposase [Gammaproteobacteria bacterium]|nr:IS1595 family transposase [Gammaproteobacteria bacterium]